jgi:predicted HAD superfamily hydrolase
MYIKTFYSLNKLVAEGKRLARSCDTITFDLFDTLLVRRIHDPDLVKIPVARYISAIAQFHGIIKSWQAVQKVRDRIEQKQRNETGNKFVDYEACYPVFMEETLQTILGSNYHSNILEDVTRYELEMESSVLVPRKLFIEWLQELKKQGKRIIIISDVYLPSSHLKLLLESAGILHLIEDVMSSADTFLAKASGEAFPMVQEKFNIDKSTWLHIGDNPISDGVRPREFGIKALLIKDSEEKFRKALIKRYYLYSKGKLFYRGRALQQLMLPMEAENIKKDHLYVEGYNFLGPMIGSFVQHIAEECRRLGLTKVFFFSREGQMFKKVWEICTPILFPDGNLPEIEYIYVSRMALASTNCAYQGLTPTSVRIAMLPPGNKDFRDIAKIFQLDLQRITPYLSKHNLTEYSCLSPRHEGYDQQYSGRLRQLLEDENFQSEVQSQTAGPNEALIRYLTELDFFNHSQIALVDIGWLGTIQRFLYNSVKQRSDCPRFHGYVLGATRGIPFNEDLNNNIKGVLYDRDRFDLAASCILYAQDVFEEACRAPHATIEQYKLTKDGYELKFRTREDVSGKAEEEQDQFYSPLQQGIFDAAKSYATASALLGYTMEDYRAWFHYVLMAKLAFPTTTEVVSIRHKHHLDDFYGTNNPLNRKLNPDKLLWTYKKNSLRFLPFLRSFKFWRHLRKVMNN